MKLLFSALIASGILSPALVGAEQGNATNAFNLVCEGSERSIDMIDGEQTRPWKQTFRIDLAKQRYCSAECAEPIAIAEVTPLRIRLSDSDDDDGVLRTTSSTTINRQDGSYSGYFRISRGRDVRSTSLTSWHGHCDKAPFTGFPAVSTKF